MDRVAYAGAPRGGEPTPKPGDIPILDEAVVGSGGVAVFLYP